MDREGDPGQSAGAGAGGSSPAGASPRGCTQRCRPLIVWWWVDVEILFSLCLFSQQNKEQGHQLQVKSRKGKDCWRFKERVVIG